MAATLSPIWQVGAEYDEYFHGGSMSGVARQHGSRFKLRSGRVSGHGGAWQVSFADRNLPPQEQIRNAVHDPSRPPTIRTDPAPPTALMPARPHCLDACTPPLL
eukprot:348379-Prymnesium_polylepis.1